MATQRVSRRELNAARPPTLRGTEIGNVLRLAACLVWCSSLLGDFMQMKTVVGFAVAAVLATGAATAAIQSPGNNTGELFEVVVDTTNGQVYARGLDIAFSAVLPPSALQSTASYSATSAPYPDGFTLPTVAADGNLTTFLGQDGGHDSFAFALLGGGQNLGGASPQLGPNKPGGNVMEFSSLNTLAAGNLTALSGSAAANAVAALETDVATLNGIIGGTPGDKSSANVSAQFNGSTSTMFQLYGNNTPILAALGQDSNLYAMTGNSSPTAAGQVYSGAEVTMLANGTLETVSAVPLPAAVWLLGSGLLGLAGIGRRRLSA
jgi:hypothetical protein